MRKYKLILISVILLSGTMAQARRIVVDSWRSGGLFGYYNRVDQQYFGVINNFDFYTLICEGPGFNRCRLHYATANTTPRESEIDAYSERFLEEEMFKIDEAIANGKERGTVSKKMQVTLSDNSQVWICIDLKWKPDTERGGYSIKGKVQDTEVI